MAVLRSASSAVPELSSEVQMGRTKVFIRHPETMLALENLLLRQRLLHSAT